MTAGRHAGAAAPQLNTGAVRQYLPSIGMTVAAVLSYLAAALTDNVLTTAELGTACITALSALLVYIVPKVPGALWLKPAIGGALVVVNGIMAALTNGISGSEWVLIALQLLGALGVAATNQHVPVTTSSPRLEAV